MGNALEDQEREKVSSKNENANRHDEKINFIQKYFSKAYDNPGSDLALYLMLSVILIV